MGKSNSSAEWCVYVLKCRNNYLYIGMTTCLQRRLQEHTDGVGSKFVRTWRPFEVIKIVPCGNGREARSLEYRLKRLKRTEKVKILGLEVGDITRKDYCQLKANIDTENISELLNNFRTMPERKKG